MSENDSVAPLPEPLRNGSTATKSSVVSPPSSTNNSITGSPPISRAPAADFGAESDPSSDSRDDENSSPTNALRKTPDALQEPPSLRTSTSRNANKDTVQSANDGEDGPIAAAAASSSSSSSATRPNASSAVARRPSFGLGFLSSISNTIRGSNSGHSTSHSTEQPSHQFMSNSPTLANLNNLTISDSSHDPSTNTPSNGRVRTSSLSRQSNDQSFVSRENTNVDVSDVTCIAENQVMPGTSSPDKVADDSGKEKDGTFSIRLTPIIDHSSSNTGLYFSPIIRRIEPKQPISVGRYTEKHKNAAHAPQGSSSRVVFKSKVVSRTHALFQCNEEGSWFLKDCKSSSGTFLNNIRLSQASQESTLWPLMDGDVVQLGLDYRGGTEEVYRCVKMRCEFNRSWQRKVNRFNLDIHKRMKNLGVEPTNENGEEFSECAICLLKLEPCQALFISPCSHSWHYKCIRPIIIKRYPQFYCPNCRSICDLETDIEDEDE